MVMPAQAYAYSSARVVENVIGSSVLMVQVSVSPSSPNFLRWPSRQKVLGRHGVQAPHDKVGTRIRFDTHLPARHLAEQCQMGVL